MPWPCGWLAQFLGTCEPTKRARLPERPATGDGPAARGGAATGRGRRASGASLAGFRWILVDEYQDIGLDQYELISAVAGRTLAEEDDRLSLFAVGDDDQNIYASTARRSSSSGASRETTAPSLPT